MTRRHDLVLACIGACIGVIVLFLMILYTQPARAADDWPCRLAGWEVGTQWGPGPEDIVPDVPICEDEPEPVASDEPVEITGDVQSEVYVGPETTPPPTDTK